MEEIRRSDERARTATWSARDHAVGVLLGVSFIAVMWGLAALQGRLVRATQMLERPSALWELLAVDVVLGVLVALAVLAGPRWPALPSTILAVLTYGVLADPFSPLREWALPDLGPWLPRISGFVGDHGRWDPAEVLLTLGVMLVATVWAWRRPSRERRAAMDEPAPADVTDTARS